MSILHYIKLLRGHALSKTWAVMVVRSGLTASYCTVQENQTLKRKCEILSFFQQHSVCCSADGPWASEHLRMSRRQELHLTLLKFNYVPRQNMILSCRVESPENKWVFKGLHLLQTTLLKKNHFCFITFAGNVIISWQTWVMSSGRRIRAVCPTLSAHGVKAVSDALWGFEKVLQPVSHSSSWREW